MHLNRWYGFAKMEKKVNGTKRMRRERRQNGELLHKELNLKENRTLLRTTNSKAV